MVNQMQMKVGNLLKRLLPAFDNVPRDLFTQAGLDFDGLVKCEVVSIEVVYSLEPLPSDHKVNFLLHPQMDGTKVTLEEQNGRDETATVEILSVGERIVGPA